ncbi:MAG: aminotransferase class I/II-fold pyridoxal phosphate-dependent enzyme [Ignavibacteriales bacterium]|nr:aminotransferase class I/II-fold pyridoxal phosphate-dependent enzyme [Ignavibacteriales bacterium]
MAAVTKYGTSCTGSRFLNGTLDLHLELEERLAKYTGMEAALVFSTGFQVNLGTIPAIMDKDDIIVTDKEVHASIIDGVRMAKVLKSVQIRTFKHNDPADLEKVLKSLPEEPAKLVIVDGVFSMGGDIAKLPEIIPICKKYGARFMCDDAHAIGVLGGGRGTGWHFGMQKDVDLVMGTFSKSLASVGGFIAGPKEAVHFIQMFARPFMFSASLPPSNVATVLACLDVLEAEPERVERVNADRRPGPERAQGHGLQHRRQRDAHHPHRHRRHDEGPGGLEGLLRGRHLHQRRPAAVRPARVLAACGRATWPPTRTSRSTRSCRSSRRSRTSSTSAAEAGRTRCPTSTSGTSGPGTTTGSTGPRTPATSSASSRWPSSRATTSSSTSARARGPWPGPSGPTSATSSAWISPTPMLKRGKWDGISMVRWDINESLFHNHLFDKIVGRMVFHHILDNLDRAFLRCYDLLKCRGRLIIAEGVPPAEDPEVVDWYTEMFKHKEVRRTFTKTLLVRYFQQERLPGRPGLQVQDEALQHQQLAGQLRPPQGQADAHPEHAPRGPGQGQGRLQHDPRERDLLRRHREPHHRRHQALGRFPSGLNVFAPAGVEPCE